MTANLINKLNSTLTVIMIKGASSIELIYIKETGKMAIMNIILDILIQHIKTMTVTNSKQYNL